MGLQPQREADVGERLGFNSVTVVIFSSTSNSPDRKTQCIKTSRQELIFTYIENQNIVPATMLRQVVAEEGRGLCHRVKPRQRNSQHSYTTVDQHQSAAT
jgi:hypothetical protein